MISQDGGGFFITGFQCGQERFGLAAKMIEIRTGRKVLFHNQSIKTCRGPQTGSTMSCI
jgi:hypothetical protein